MKPLFRSKGSYNCRIIASDPLLYFPLDEASGSVAKNWGSLGAAANGSYTGVDLHSTPGPKGGGAPYFDGVNDSVDINSAGLAAAFPGSEGSVLAWAKVYDAAVWTDSQGRYVVQFNDGASNVFNMRRAPTDYYLTWYYNAGGVSKVKNKTDGNSLDWMALVCTWSASADECIVYYNGEQYGSKLTSLGVWDGTIDSSLCAIGSYSNSPSYVWKGYISHVALWDRALTPAEILSLYQ